MFKPASGIRITDKAMLRRINIIIIVLFIVVVLSVLTMIYTTVTTPVQAAIAEAHGPLSANERVFDTDAERKEFFALAKYHMGTGAFGRPKFIVTWSDRNGQWYFRRESDGKVCKFAWPKGYRYNR